MARQRNGDLGLRAMPAQGDIQEGTLQREVITSSP